jgi:hypothetical protein
VTYTTQSGQTNYVWTVPGTLGTDYTITSGGIGTTSNTVTLKWLTVGSKTVTINYTSSSCSAGTATSSTATTVSTLPTPTFTAQPGATACPNTDVTYTTESGQSNYVWTVPGTLNTDYSITSGGVGTTSNTVTLKWLTTGSKTITIRYTSNGCAATTATSSTATSVSTIPTPTFTAQPGATACASTDVTYTTQAAQTNYVWTVPGTENTDYTITSGGVGSSSNTVTLKWLSTGSKTITINYTNSCNNSATTATSSTATTVNGSPTTANAGVDQTSAATCGLTSVTLAGNTPTVGTGAWSIVSGTGGTVTTPSSATSTFTGTAGSTYTLRWTISNSACTASTDDVVITFNQPSVAGTISGAGSTCFGTDKILTLTGNTGTIQWQVSTTSSSSGFSDISGATASTYTVPSTNAVGTYYYQALVTNGVCSAATTATAATVNVIAYPTVAAITGNDDVCLSGSTTLSNATAGGVWSSTTPSIATINSTSGLVTGVASGSATLNYTVTNYAAGESAYGSVLLNGTNQSLSLNPGIGTIGTGAFTFECWFKLNSTPSNRSSILGTGTGNYLSINVNSLTEIETDAYGINRLGFAVPTMSVGTWYHLAVVRNSSGVETIFLNGVRSTTGAVTDSKNYNGPSKTIGHWQAGTYFPGNLASIRAVVGSALYDPSQSTITVPSFPLSSVTNTKLLLLAASSATLLTDGSGVQTVTNNNTSTWSSSAPASSIGCPTTVTKTVSVNPFLTVTAASSSPIVNINTAITNITHTTTGATGITNNGVSGANGLPAGISAAWSGNTITISGTPTVAGTFNYSIPLITGCNVVSATGTIIVFSVWSWTGLGGNNLWSDGNNWSAGTIPISGRSIEINSGNVQMDLDYAVGRSLTLSGSATLTVQAGKTLSIPSGGVADFGGKLVTFKSDATGTGQLGDVTGTLTGATNVVVERHIPAGKRAFRFFSSSVTTTGSIRQNWMEGATPGVNSQYPYTTQSVYNPNPGYGTHITGSGGNTNGFDESVSNNPSLFIFNNSTGAWAEVTSTAGTISAGSAYRMFVRGNRSYAMSNIIEPSGESTILRTIGTIATGTQTSGNQLPALSQVLGGWSLVGNPYQSVVDMSAASVVKTNLTNYYYIWDPRMGTQGAYVAYNYVTNTSANTSSGVNRYVQPGQAFFVQSSAVGSAIQFTEAAKGAASNQTATFGKNDGKGNKDGYTIAITQQRNEVLQTGGFASLSMLLYQTDSLLKGGMPADAARVLFEKGNNNNVDVQDGKKLTNPDEMMSVRQGNTLLSMEMRALPDTGTLLPLSITQYRGTKYTLRVYWDKLLTDSTKKAYLKDKFTAKEYVIERGGTYTDLAYTITSDAKSSAADRFEVVFKTSANVVTAVTNWSNGDYIKVYPNPVISLIQVDYKLGMQRELTLKVYDMSGREVLAQKKVKSGDQVNMSILLRGIYQYQLLDKTGKLLMAGKLLKD